MLYKYTTFAMQTNTNCIMKRIFILFLCALTGAGAMTSCQPQQTETKQAAETQFLAESNSLVGLWQRMQSTEITDEETGETLTLLTPKPRFKCIMPDGTYYLLNCKVDANGNVTSAIDHYGTYELIGDTLQLEHINVCSSQPRLSGVTSHVRYSLPDVNTLTMYYNFGLEGGLEEGSNEWVPETWRRVSMGSEL